MLRADIYNEVLATLNPMGKDFSWLSYTIYADGQYKVLSGKEDQYHVLKQILKKLVNKYPNTSGGKLAQLLSEIVNIPTFE